MKNVENKSFKTRKLTSCIIDLKYVICSRACHTTHQRNKFDIVSDYAHVFVSKQCKQIK